jgi:hypothetical protein
MSGRPSDAESEDELSPLPPHYTLVHIRLGILIAALFLTFSGKEIRNKSLFELIAFQQASGCELYNNARAVASHTTCHRLYHPTRIYQYITRSASCHR